jgi:hypothetical protein
MDFGSLNLENIENIINSMSQKDIEDLSSIASQFFSAGSDSPKKQEEKIDGIDFETITKIASVLGKLSSQPKDPSCELLSALKPMLSPERRHKADEAIKMIQLISLLPLLKDLQ